MPGAAGSSLLMMLTWAERFVGDATVTTQPRSIATSKPSRSTKNSRVSAGRSDLMFGTARLPITLRSTARSPAGPLPGLLRRPLLRAAEAVGVAGAQRHPAALAHGIDPHGHPHGAA